MPPDNTPITPGTGATIATDDVSGVQYQRVKVTLGADGVSDGDVSAANPMPVSGAFYPVTQPVSGTFWQATQPVSGTVAVSGSVAVTGTFWQATQPVSGTFWQATQPVSIAATVAVSGPLTDAQIRASALPVSGTFWQTTQPVSIATLPALAAGTANIGDVDVLTLPAIPAGNNNIGDVDIASFPTLTKGTQGATGVSVQPLRDAGRTLCAFTATALATVTSEALVQLTPYRDLTAGGGATTFAVTSGKKLRLQSLILTIRATSTVNVGGLVRFRMLAGTVLVSSPVVLAVGGMSSNLATAVAGNAQTYFVDFPEGFELSGTMQFGLTQLFSATTATIDVTVIGYEY